MWLYVLWLYLLWPCLLWLYLLWLYLLWLYLLWPYLLWPYVLGAAAFVVTLRAEQQNVDECIGTLRFAQRAKVSSQCEQ